MIIAIIDYGMGNLRSVQKAFEHVGAQAIITRVPAIVLKADKVVLPGVGAMAPAMLKLNELGLTDCIRRIAKEGKPFFGICLGMQLLFDRSTEGGFSEGLKLVRGTVERFTQGKVPHMGWNQIKIQPSGQIMFNGITDNADVYFCHSYFVKPTDQSITAAVTNYGIDYASAIADKNIWGAQFHPEKSQSIGLKILENFAKL